jgi:hypothetical protein
VSGLRRNNTSARSQLAPGDDRYLLLQGPTATIRCTPDKVSASAQVSSPRTRGTPLWLGQPWSRTSDPPACGWPPLGMPPFQAFRLIGPPYRVIGCGSPVAPAHMHPHPLLHLDLARTATRRIFFFISFASQARLLFTRFDNVPTAAFHTLFTSLSTTRTLSTLFESDLSTLD